MFVQHDFDLVSWITDDNREPEEGDLALAPLSYPLIFVTQLCSYLVFLDEAQLTHEQAMQRTRCLSGHSQGLMSAVLLSWATCEEKLYTCAAEIVKVMFWIGLRCQSAADNIIRRRTAAIDLEKVGEGERAAQSASPMLAVVGFATEEVGEILRETQSRFQLPPSRQLELALVNGRDACIISGHPDSLLAVVEFVKSISVPR